MEVIALAVAGGLVLGVLLGGSAAQLLDTPVRLIPLVLAAVGARLALAMWQPSGGSADDLAFGIQLGSLLLVAAFLVANIRVRGVPVVLVGVVANALVIALNGAMPLALPGGASDAERDALRESPVYVAEGGATLAWLGQTIPVPSPMDRPVSFGDLILGVGLANAVFWASRTTSRKPHPETAPKRLTLRMAGEVSPESGASGTSDVHVDAGATGHDPGERRENPAVPAFPA